MSVGSLDEVLMKVKKWIDGPLVMKRAFVKEIPIT